MGLSLGAACIKWLLFAVNLVFLLCGTLTLAVGIWIKIDVSSFVGSVDKMAANAEASYFMRSALESSSNSVHIASYVLIGIGAFALLVSLFGCCGACNEWRPLLIVYGICLILVLGTEVAVAAAGGIMKDQVGQDIRHVLQRMADRYGYVKTALSVDSRILIQPNQTRDHSDPAHTAFFNALQTWYGCCGIDSYKDFSRSPYWEAIIGLQIAPVFCCKFSQVSRLKLQDASCYELGGRHNGLLSNYEMGCYTKITNFFHHNLPLVIGVTVGCALIQILAIILVFSLVRAIGRKGEYVTEYKRMNVISVD